MNTQTNAILETHCSLERLGREIGALDENERLVTMDEYQELTRTSAQLR